MIWAKGEDQQCPPRCLNIDQPTTQGRYTHVLVPSVVALYRDDIWVGEGTKRLRAQPGAGAMEHKSWFAETKNDIGIRRTYHRAPAGLQSARAIAAQRQDTVSAAQRAGMSLADGDLLDEPVAAFLTYFG